jgi:hypothetical protein
MTTSKVVALIRYEGANPFTNTVDSGVVEYT